MMVMQLPLQSRTALVTGVSRKIGIGYAIAQRLSQKGANLFLQGLPTYDAEQPWGADANGIEVLATEINTQTKTIAADFTDPKAPQQLIDAAIAEFKHIDILVINHAYSTMGALEDLTAEHIDRHWQVNVRASLLLIKAFAAQHNRETGGRIIIMTSGQHLSAMPDELAYISSKGALHQLTKSLAAHLAPRKITVNTINPGATDTGYADETLHNEVLKHQPMGRWGEPDDAARLIAWLATDDAEWITGQIINSTGGGL